MNACNCQHSKNTNINYLKWTENFLKNTISNIQIIEDTFQIMIEIYYDNISTGQKNSLERMWDFIIKNNLATGSENPIIYNKLLFRARENDGKIDIKNPDTFFHIPFNKRYHVGNQRFSIAGQPMLYFGNSVLCIEKELGKPIADLAISAFLPNYSIYYSKKIFVLKNSIFDVLVKSLPGLFSGGGDADYFDTAIIPNVNSIKKDLQKSILAEIFTFPVKDKKTFVEEYVLPQLFTSLLMNKQYDGIIFPSTKDYACLANYHLFTDFDINMAFFVNYVLESEYDRILQNTFDVFIFDGKEKLSYKTEDVLDKKKLVTNRKRTATKNYNDFLIPLVNTELQIKYLEKALLNGIPYFETKEGKIELEFYYKLIEKTDAYII